VFKLPMVPALLAQARVQAGCRLGWLHSARMNGWTAGCLPISQMPKHLRLHTLA